MKHEDKRKARAFQMVNIVKECEGTAPKVIIAKFCMQTGLSLEKGQEFFQMLREAGHLELNEGCVFIKQKLEEPKYNQKEDPRLSPEENAIIGAKPADD